MLIIRGEQFEALSAGRWRQFKARVAAHVTEVLPARAAALGTNGLTAAIDRHVAAGQGWGLASERDLARYVDLLLGLGPEIGADVPGSWIGPMMADQSLPPGERLAIIYAMLPERAPECAKLAAWWVS